MAEQRKAEVVKEDPANTPAAPTISYLERTPEHDKVMEAIESGQDPNEVVAPEKPGTEEPAPGQQVVVPAEPASPAAGEPVVPTEPVVTEPVVQAEDAAEIARRAELEELRDIDPELTSAMAELPEEQRKLFEKQLRADRNRLMRAESSVEKRRREMERQQTEHLERLRAIMAREAAAPEAAPGAPVTSVEEAAAAGIPVEVNEDGTVHLKPEDLNTLVDQRLQANLAPRMAAVQGQQSRQNRISQELQATGFDEPSAKVFGRAFEIFHEGAQKTLQGILHRAPTSQDLASLSMDQLVSAMKAAGVEDQLKAELPNIDLSDIAQIEQAFGNEQTVGFAAPYLQKIRAGAATPVVTPAADAGGNGAPVIPEEERPRSQAKRGAPVAPSGNATEAFLALTASQIQRLTKKEYDDWKLRLAEEGYSLQI